MKRYLFVLLGLLLVLVWLHMRFQNRICSHHVINMESSRERYAEFQTYARNAGIHVTRWPAVDGQSIQSSDLKRLKLSRTAYKYSKHMKQPGILGCYLSHRTLLTHLATTHAGPNDIHFIFEDDAHIPTDFTAQWNITAKDLPHDWDFVYLGITFPNIKSYKGRLHTPMAQHEGNQGMFAYAVKHSSLHKINKLLEYMSDPADNMIANKHGAWNVFVIYPELCPHNDHGKSSIVPIQ